MNRASTYGRYQKQPTLRPNDLVIACQLALTSDAQFKAVSRSTGSSVGECHNAVRRLGIARLILADERRTAGELLHQFLVHGAPFAFPAVIGAEIVGVPTAHSAPPFQGIVGSDTGFVWAHADGTLRGQSIIPLFPGAPLLAVDNPALYELLALIDALRVGGARVRTIAADMLGDRILGRKS
jgi:hypothetical protein